MNNDLVMTPEIKRARELRRNMSQPEIILWSRLKTLRPRGYPFRRQFPFKGYFLDFACLSYGLIVEVDGPQHHDARQAEHDFVRDKILEREGFRVLRYSADDVRGNLNGVVDDIIQRLEGLRRGKERAARSAAPRLGHTPSP